MALWPTWWAAGPAGNSVCAALPDDSQDCVKFEGLREHGGRVCRCGGREGGRVLLARRMVLYIGVRNTLVC